MKTLIVPRIDRGPLLSLFAKYLLVAPLFYAMFFLETKDHFVSMAGFSIFTIVFLSVCILGYSYLCYGNFSLKDNTPK